MASRDSNTTYAAGFLHARQVYFDESSGEAEPAPGVHLRVACDEIVMYHASLGGTTEVWRRGDPDPLSLCCTVQEVDEVLKRHWLLTHRSGKTDE